MNDQEDNLLMSEELQGMVPEIEDNLEKYHDSFIIAGLQFYNDKEKIVHSGTVTGFSVEDNVIRIDVKSTIEEAYYIVKKHVDGNLKCDVCYMQYVDNDIILKGPFNISSAKMMEFDREAKLCVLGVDLVRV